MIIKRKLFTRQEAKAMKEIYEALKKGNLGRNLSAREFLKLRRVGNETIDALRRQSKWEVSDFQENAEVIKNLGLPETSKAYQQIVEKYSNPRLRARLKSIQDASTNNRLKNLRKKKKDIEGMIDFSDPTGPTKRISRSIYGKRDSYVREDLAEEHKNILREIEKVKKERGSKKNYKFNRKELEDTALKEQDNISSLHEEAKRQATDYKTGTKTKGAKTSWKIKNQLQKEGANAKIDGNKGSYYNREEDKIHVTRPDSRDPLSVLHEDGHRVSNKRGEVSGVDSGYYNGWEKLNPDRNSGDNLRGSIMNGISHLTTLTEEANASYHATARAKKYGITKKQLKRGKGILDGAFKTYERDAAAKINHDNYTRGLGKAVNK